MPEGDTVHVTCQRLHRALAGAEVTRFDLRVPALALADLTGTRVDAVLPRGKHILMRFSNQQTLHSHLRMDGSWRVGPARRGPRGREFEIRALIGNAAYLAAGFRVHDLRLVPTADESLVVGHLGPDLLDPDFDRAEALRRFGQQPERPIGEALLDQRLVAGIGNVYKSEVLFRRHINPERAVAEVTQPELADLLDDAQRLLRANLTTFDRSTTGWRQPGQHYWVYGRAGKACRNCGATIRRDDGAGGAGGSPEDRITFFCPSCQAR